MADPRRMLRVRRLIAALCLTAFCVTAGCARTRVDLPAARHAYAAGDLSAASTALQQLANSSKSSRSPAELDLAMVELASGNPVAAERRLRSLRDRFDNQPELDLAKEAASFLTDDTKRQFVPAGYEEVMIRAMLSVCSLAGDQIDAESYALQATMRQEQLAQEAEARGLSNAAEVFQPIAMAPYLRGVLREATHRDYDDAERAYRLVSAVRPQFAPASADLDRVIDGQHSASGHGVLYVIGCVGRGPVLTEVVAPTTSQSLSIASAILNSKTNQKTNGGRKRDGLALPNIASVKIPEVAVPNDNLAALGVVLEGHLRGATQTLTDIGELATLQVQSERPWTIARAVVRRAAKEAAIAKAGDSLGLEGSAGSVFHFATASAWSGIEHADTRCWGLLPREIQVFRIELPIGTHTIDLLPLSYHGEPMREAQSCQVQIDDGRNAYVIAIATDQTTYVIH